MSTVISGSPAGDSRVYGVHYGYIWRMGPVRSTFWRTGPVLCVGAVSMRLTLSHFVFVMGVTGVDAATGRTEPQDPGQANGLKRAVPVE